MALGFNVLLIDIIDILAKNYTVHVSVDGYIVGTFANADEIPYKYLKMHVKRIYPGTVENEHKCIDGITGLDPVAPKAIMGIDLETFDNED